MHRYKRRFLISFLTVLGCLAINATPACAHQLQNTTDLSANNTMSVTISNGTSKVAMLPRRYFTYTKMLVGESKDSAEVGSCAVLINGTVTATFGTAYFYTAQLTAFGEKAQFSGESVNPAIDVFSFGGLVTNQCEKDISGYIHLYIVHDITGEEAEVAHSSEMLKIPAMKTCGAKVSDTLDLGSLRAGDTKTLPLTLQKSGNGDGTVTLSGEDLSTGGELSLGADPSVTVTPDDPTHIDENGHWISGADNDSLPLKVTVLKDAKPGTRKSTLTATLSCE